MLRDLVIHQALDEVWPDDGARWKVRDHQRPKLWKVILSGCMDIRKRNKKIPMNELSQSGTKQLTDQLTDWQADIAVHRVMFRADKDCWQGHCWSELCCVALASPVDMAVLVIGLMARSPTHRVDVRDNIEYFGPGEQWGEKTPCSTDRNWLHVQPEPIVLPDAQPHRCYSGIHFTTLYITIFCRKHAVHMATCWPTKKNKK